MKISDINYNKLYMSPHFFLLLLLCTGLLKAEKKTIIKKPNSNNIMAFNQIRTIGGIKFVYIQGGNFLMGSPANARDYFSWRLYSADRYRYHIDDKTSSMGFRIITPVK